MFLESDSPMSDTLRTPMLVANVSMPFALSPSMSGRSFVMAMTMAKIVTNTVMKLWGGKTTGKR